jgi:chemotaxis signal transduction protein
MQRNPAPASRQLLIFRCAGHSCAIAVEEIQEISHIAQTFAVPGQPSALFGFLNLRGVAIPVVALTRLFGAGNPISDLYAPLIVVRTGNKTLALLADDVDEVFEVDPEDLRPIGEDASFNHCAKAQFTWNDQSVAVLETERLLLAKERECVAELEAEAQRRLSELKTKPA